MISKAVLKYIRITPRKFRQVVPLIKGRRAEEAMAILVSVKKGAAKHMIELLKSAIANAKRKKQSVDVSNLYISKLIADCGPTLKRFRAASMGRASEILKRTSHLTLELDEIKVIEEHHEHKGRDKEAHPHTHKKESANKARNKEHVKEHAKHAGPGKKGKE